MNADGHQQKKLPFNIRQIHQSEGASFSLADIARIRDAIKKKYAGVATTAENYFSYPVGKAGTLLLDYDKEFLKDIPDALLNSFCGVGNPFSINSIKNGCAILDIGCGTGFDLYIASRLVGEQGKVCGVDLCLEMTQKAQTTLAALQVKNAEVLLISSEELPFTDAVFDVVISNGVINLSPDKPYLFKEIHRVLKPGGRLQFADIILKKELPAHLASSAESWSQ